jgi:hypothetical protein
MIFPERNILEIPTKEAPSAAMGRYYSSGFEQSHIFPYCLNQFLLETKPSLSSSILIVDDHSAINKIITQI